MSLKPITNIDKTRIDRKKARRNKNLEELAELLLNDERMRLELLLMIGNQHNVVRYILKSGKHEHLELLLGKDVNWTDFVREYMCPEFAEFLLSAENVDDHDLRWMTFYTTSHFIVGQPKPL